MPAWSARRIHIRARWLHVIRWYSVLVPSMMLAEAAKTAAASTRVVGAASTKIGPTMHETAKAAPCSAPRSVGRGGTIGTGHCAKTKSVGALATSGEVRSDVSR